jgi:hypothetical protein
MLLSEAARLMAAVVGHCPDFSALSPCHHLAERETFHQRENPDASKLI